MSTDRTEVVIRLRPLPGSRWIKEDPAMSFSDVCFAGEAEQLLESEACPRQLTVVSVRLNGREIPHRVLSPTTVRLMPRLRLEGDRLDIECTRPQEPVTGLKSLPATYPAPDLGYGLQRAVNLPARHPQ